MIISKKKNDCPFDNIQINENQVRLNALFVFLLIFSYLLSGSIYIILYLLLDFLLRAFGFQKFSLNNFICRKAVGIFKIKYIPIDQGPKRLAAMMGLLFTFMILVFNILTIPVLVYFISVCLALFSFLESFVGFCAGCYVYSFYKRMTLKF